MDWCEHCVQALLSDPDIRCDLGSEVKECSQCKAEAHSCIRVDKYHACQMARLKRSIKAYDEARQPPHSSDKTGAAQENQDGPYNAHTEEWIETRRVLLGFARRLDYQILARKVNSKKGPPIDMTEALKNVASAWAEAERMEKSSVQDSQKEHMSDFPGGSDE